MKQFFSRRSVALLLAVLVVISTTLFQTRFRFGRLCSEVTDQFYYGSGSIASELVQLSDSAEILAGLAHLYNLDEAKAAMNTTSSLRELLRLESSEIAAIHDLYKELLSETFTLESLLARQELSDAEADLLSSAQHEAAQAKAAIDASGYHDTVRVFLKRYDRFPTTALAALVGLKMPQVFS